MGVKITTKHQMYALLAAGRLGNTIPQYFSVADWQASMDSGRYQFWGIRTLAPGGPCRLNCPVEEVVATVTKFQSIGHAINISVMVDRLFTVLLWAEVMRTETGLVVYGIERPPFGGSWRQLMPGRGMHWQGVMALMLLLRHLNPNSLDDLWELLDTYPDHVVELSALDRCYGTVPGRNAIIWEVRAY